MASKLKHFNQNIMQRLRSLNLRSKTRLNTEQLLYLKSFTHYKFHTFMSKIGFINNCMNALYQDRSLFLIFEYHGQTVENKHMLLMDIKNAVENSWSENPKSKYHHSDRYFNNLTKKAVNSPCKWFYNYIPKSTLVPHSKADRIQRVSLACCRKLLDKALYIRTKLTAKKCASLLLNWIESFSDDDTCSDVIKFIKPMAEMAGNQVQKDQANQCYDQHYASCDEQLRYIVIWYECLEDNVYHPSFRDRVPTYAKPKDKHKFSLPPFQKTGTKCLRFPSRDNRISVDALQQFLRPLAYMLSIPLHRKVYFAYTLFSGD